MGDREERITCLDENETDDSCQDIAMPRCCAMKEKRKCKSEPKSRSTLVTTGRKTRSALCASPSPSPSKNASSG